ncbi:Acetyl esterase/lipase [Sphingomonas palmae]|uniref:Acetyl esterase/lipase n=1 Tax=Sphingomonas palmae TaxID=1855283 RepID=A0A1H7MS75_9SPHN|nr:alpha/beta hydrolase [Sphingomonas palmae]SEL14112.1 Acetyl esterase/lipase [Sphingomonas palmae]
MTRLSDPGLAPAPFAPIDDPSPAGAIPLVHTPDGQERADESWFLLNGQATARNVAHPTLTPFLPDPSLATGAAMIVAPGGGFAVASLENEGWPVAEWLAAHGVAAFVLKYRLEPTPAAPADFQVAMIQRVAAAIAQAGRVELAVPDAATADARAALRLMRARAAEWRVDPARVGVLGFSAGAMTALSLVQPNKADAHPDLIGAIYPSMKAMPVPADAPPLFIAMAADDPLFGRQGYDLAAGWRAADRPVELHVYQNGGHGFGMGREGATSRHWRRAFADWLALHGWLDQGAQRSRENEEPQPHR